MTHPDWLRVTPGEAPLVVSVPHAGTWFPPGFSSRLVSEWLATKDADWYLDRVYDFAADLGATVVRTDVSRTVIDVNRDPDGVSLYPGQATTALCPVDTFDGEHLYAPGDAPDASEIAARRVRYYDPYHAALDRELSRLRARYPQVVIYDAHSIRSVIPRLFTGTLPQWNIGTNDGRSCASALTRMVESHCDRTGAPRVTNGRFKGGYITRHYGRPDDGVHALQMELACRGYLREPAEAVTSVNWPAPYDESAAAELRRTLRAILEGAAAFAIEAATSPARGVL